MLAAKPTHPLDFRAQPFSGPVQSNCDIVSADVEKPLPGRHTVQVHLFKRFAILRRQIRKKLFQTMAQRGLGTAIGLLWELGFDSFKKTVLGASTPVKVDNRMTQVR